MAEQWHPLPGFEGVYEASSEGRIRRVAKGRGTPGDTVLRAQQNTSGYAKVNLSMHNRRYQRLVHVLVAEAFLGPKPSGRSHVNHKNGDRRDNRVVNLEYVTPARNNEHRLYELPENTLGLTADQARAIRDLYARGEYTQRALADLYGVSQNQISLIVQGKAWKKAGGPITKTGQGTRQRKLTMRQARALRKDRARGLSYPKLAAKYGVSQGTVSAILSGKSFREE